MSHTNKFDVPRELRLKGLTTWERSFGSKRASVDFATLFNAYPKHLKNGTTPNLRYILDYKVTASVSKNSWIGTMIRFGPLRSLHRNIKSVTTMRGFYGFTPQAEAHRLLQSKLRRGCYLIRLSLRQPHVFHIDYVRKNEEIKTLDVYKRKDGGYTYISKGSYVSVESLRLVVSACSYLQEAYSSSYSRLSFFHGGTTVTQAEELLRDEGIGAYLVRFSSSSKNQLALSYVEANNGISHVKIFLQQDNTYIVSSNVYKNLSAMLVSNPKARQAFERPVHVQHRCLSVIHPGRRSRREPSASTGRKSNGSNTSGAPPAIDTSQIDRLIQDHELPSPLDRPKTRPLKRRTSPEGTGGDTTERFATVVATPSAKDRVRDGIAETYAASSTSVYSTDTESGDRPITYKTTEACAPNNYNLIPPAKWAQKSALNDYSDSDEGFRSTTPRDNHTDLLLSPHMEEESSSTYIANKQTESPPLSREMVRTGSSQGRNGLRARRKSSGMSRGRDSINGTKKSRSQKILSNRAIVVVSDSEDSSVFPMSGRGMRTEINTDALNSRTTTSDSEIPLSQNPKFSTATRASHMETYSSPSDSDSSLSPFNRSKIEELQPESATFSNMGSTRSPMMVPGAGDAGPFYSDDESLSVFNTPRVDLVAMMHKLGHRELERMLHFVDMIPGDMDKLSNFLKVVVDTQEDYLRKTQK